MEKLSSTVISSVVYRPQCNSSQNIVDVNILNYICRREKYIFPQINTPQQLHISVARQQYLSLKFQSNCTGICHSSYISGTLRIYSYHTHPYYIYVKKILANITLEMNLTLSCGQTYLLDRNIQDPVIPRYIFTAEYTGNSTCKISYDWIAYRPLQDYKKHIKYITKRDIKLKYLKIVNTFPNYISWLNAASICKRHNMTLVTIHDLEDNLDIPAIVSSLPHSSWPRKPFLIYVGLMRKVRR